MDRRGNGWNGGSRLHLRRRQTHYSVDGNPCAREFRRAARAACTLIITMSNVVVHAPSVHIVREPIGHRWTDELVSFDFDSRAVIDHVRVVDEATGAALPSQVVARIEDG